MGINWIEKDFQVYDVINAEEAFGKHSYCVAPVTKINGLTDKQWGDRACI